MIETFDVPRGRFRKRHLLIILAAAGLLLALSLFWLLVRPPSNFPLNDAVLIPRGLPASQIADLLEEKEVVRSSFILYLALLWKYDPSGVQAGTFLFDHPLSVFEVASRITTVGGTSNLISVTLPEGFTLAEYAKIAAEGLPDFSEDEFLELTSDREGYFFPDTYYVPADFTAAEMAALLEETYELRIAPFREEIAAHDLTEEEVIILASLIEREANTEESMKLVSGILQNRLEEGMRLQVDASLEYVLDRPLNTLTAADLEIDSSYNTYLYGGLPPTPIGNPGLQSIEAVLNPTESDYFYYLTDEEGDFYYAATFDEHQENIAKYLK